MADAPVAEPEQAPAEVVQDAPLAEPDAPAAETTEIPSAETSEPGAEAPPESPKARKRSKPASSFSNQLAQLQKHPDYEAHTKAEREKTRQQEMGRLRREAGSKEQVAARTKTIFETAFKHAGVDNPELPRDINDNMSFVYDLAEANAAEQMLRGMAEHTLQALGVENAADTAKMLTKDINQLGPYTIGLIEQATDAHKRKIDSEFEARVNTEVTKRLQGEVDAKDLESVMAGQPESAPNAPRGSEATPKRGPTPREYASATREQRRKWGEAGVEVQISEG